MEKITIDEAREIGYLWKVIGDQITTLAVRTMHFLPKNSKAYRNCDRAINTFSSAKSDVEDEFFRRMNDMNTDVFYGDRPDSRFVTEALEKMVREYHQQKRRTTDEGTY